MPSRNAFCVGMMVAALFGACHRPGADATSDKGAEERGRKANHPGQSTGPAAAGPGPANSLDIAAAAPMTTPTNGFAPQAAPPVAFDGSAPGWEQVLGRLAPLDPPNRARTIFAMMPTLPPEAMSTAASLAVQGVTDADYSSTALPVIVNPTTRGQVMSVLFADLLERSPTVSLPALVSIASTPNHAFAPSALDDLRLLLGADYGNDWQRWNQAVQEKLAALQ